MSQITCPECGHNFPNSRENKADHSFDFPVRKLLRLADIEKSLKQNGVFDKLPSRRTLIEMCKDGTWEAKDTRFGWMVFEDSFDSWARDFQGVDVKKLPDRQPFLYYQTI